MASMIGTPMQIDDGTLNQSKLSKAWACIELDLLKPRLEEFKIHIFGETIVQRIEYEQILHYCSLCKHVGHRYSECYSKGNVPKPTTRKPSKGVGADVEKRKGTHVVEAVERDKALTRKIGECSKTVDRAEQFQITKNGRYHTEYRTDYMASVDSIFIFENAVSKLKDYVVVHENIVSVDVADTTCDNDKTRDKNLEYKVADGNWTHVENAIMLLEQNSEEDQNSENSEEDQNSEEGEIMNSNARSLKIRNSICLTNHNLVDTESVEQLLQELATPTRLPKNQFPMND
ncbi:UNVERIFIED_CONTAM: hypothetical protein Sindi_0161300 [Sesamum indicum]